MKIFLIVIDGFGIGELPDASLYGDVGANTYKSIEKKLKSPFLNKLGLTNIFGVSTHHKIEALGCYGRIRELSEGKDTLTGHHEIAGIVTLNAAPTYANGFSQEIIDKLENAFGRKILGNVVASGTEIINTLGEEHTKTGCPIVYTSQDSVLQIACNESIISVEELYDMCKKARKIMVGDNEVGRIIARPFVKKGNKFIRTENRKDFGVPPRSKTLLDVLMENGITTVGIGKINDIFNGKGVEINKNVHGNEDCAKAMFDECEVDYKNALIFVNFVDTDMLYGHRNDAEGYKQCLEHLDIILENLKENMTGDDILIITSDHGCDPGFKTTDHTREYVPLLIYGRNLANNVDLGTVHGLNTIAFTILDLFNVFQSEKSLKPIITRKKRKLTLKKIIK